LLGFLGYFQVLDQFLSLFVFGSFGHDDEFFQEFLSMIGSFLAYVAELLLYLM